MHSHPSIEEAIDHRPPGHLSRSCLLCSVRELRAFSGQGDRRAAGLVFPGSRIYSARLVTCAPFPGKVIDDQPPGLPGHSCLLCSARELRAFSGQGDRRAAGLVFPGTRVYSARLANCALSPGKVIDYQPPGLPGHSCLLCSARELRAFSGQDDRGSAAWSSRAVVSTLLGSRTARLLRERRSRISRLVHPGTRVYSARLANCAPPPGKAIEDQPPGPPGHSCLLCSARELRASSGQGDRGSAAWSSRAVVSTPQVNQHRQHERYALLVYVPASGAQQRSQSSCRQPFQARLSPVAPHNGAAGPPVCSRPARRRGHSAVVISSACLPSPARRRGQSACLPSPARRRGQSACLPCSGSTARPVRLSPLTGSTARPVRLSPLTGSTARPVRLSPMVRLDGAACPPVSYGPARRRGLSACLLWSGSTARPVRLSPMVRLDGAACPPVSPHRLDGAASPPVSYGPARRRGLSACLLWSGSTAINLQSRRNGLSHFPSLGMECLILLGLL
nr:uncharacterized protein LOC110379115 isoform X1 [Helicoverpa armigera]